MKPVVCVIIPTFGGASFALWAIKSVQNQTFRNIEICIICDGSPENAFLFFKEMQKSDNRIKVYLFPKSERTGEPYRDIVIKETEADIICYCSHDDLWLPNHIAVIVNSLKKCCFTHTMHTVINNPELIKTTRKVIGNFFNIDLKDDKIVESMFRGINYFGLTFVAHRKEIYFELNERWVTTPTKEIPTDLYMWRKFLELYRDKCKTTRKITALNFPRLQRINWTDKQRLDELEYYYSKLSSPVYRYWLKISAKYFPTNEILI